MTLGKCQKGFIYVIIPSKRLLYWLSSGTDHDAMFVVLYNSLYFHLSDLFTYPNEIFVAFDRWGLDN